MSTTASVLITTEAGTAQDARESTGLDVTVVVGNGNRLLPAWMSHDVVAAADAVELPAASFQRTDQLLGFDRRELIAHGVATTTRSCTAGLGDQPRSRMASR
jgi:hypothetical protein